MTELRDFYGCENVPAQRKLVRLSQMDVENGEPGVPNACPVARRLRGMLRDEVSVSVSTVSVSIIDHKDHRRFNLALPNAFSVFIQNFDYGNGHHDPNAGAYMVLPKYLLRNLRKEKKKT